jgi:hypothetical protein
MTEHDPHDVERALEEYADHTQETPPPGFSDWVMRSIASEPLPRRGVWASLTRLVGGGGPYRRAAQVALVALLLVASIVSAVAIGSLIDNDGPAPVPSPSLEASASPSPTTAAPTPFESPDESDDEDELETPEPTETPRP